MVAVAVSLIASSVLAPSAGAKGKRKASPKPDLKFSRVETSLGGIPGRPWGQVGTDGVLRPVDVQVTIVNQGNARSGATQADVVIQDAAHHRFVNRFTVPPVKPHKHISKTVKFTGDKAALGIANISATIDPNNRVNESDENNNFWPAPSDPFSKTHKPETFPIVAEEWDVTTFSVVGTDLFRSLVTSARSGTFSFKLSSFDGDKFHYLAYGTVDNKVKETGVCTGTSDETRSGRPWKGNSSLDIDYDLAGYDAGVLAPHEFYTVTVSCFGIGSHTEKHQWPALQTFIGPEHTPAMRPTDTTIQRKYVDSLLQTTWSWDFRAKLGG